MNAPDLFTAARDSRDRALAIHEDRQPDWLDLAVAAIRTVAEKQPTMTSDDAWAQGLPEPPEPRAMGAAFVRARAEGIIDRTGLTRASDRGTNNARHLRVWASKLYRPNAYEESGRERKAFALARVLWKLDNDLPGAGSPEPLSARAAAQPPSFWEGLAALSDRKVPSEATICRVIEILSEQEARDVA